MDRGLWPGLARRFETWKTTTTEFGTYFIIFFVKEFWSGLPPIGLWRSVGLQE